MNRRLNLLIVPEDGGEPRRLRPSVFWLRVLGVVGVILLLGALFGAFTWSGLARRALSYDRLRVENQRLEMENRRILRVAREVDQSRRILAQIVRSLGGKLELGQGLASDSIPTIN